MKQLLTDFVTLFFPSLCLWCDNALLTHEEYLCIACQLQLPKTKFHLNAGNAADKIFYGRVPVSNAASFLFFNKGGITQAVVHALKYKNQPRLATMLGFQYGYELKQAAWIKNIDVIIPVPIHVNRMRERGYNQAQLFAQGLSSALSISCNTVCLSKKTGTATQTKRGRFSRWQNMEETFFVTAPTLLYDKHVLLVDDVITTGATLEACATEILKIPNTKVSIATIAYTQNI